MLLGTADTKADEILFMKECIAGQEIFSPFVEVFLVKEYAKP